MCITYIEICSRLGLVERALGMFAEMRAAGPGSRMAPTVHAYTAAMRAATEGGKWHKALEIWRDMRSAGCQPTGAPLPGAAAWT
jgi:pentatricopeptide repeat protein